MYHKSTIQYQRERLTIDLHDNELLPRSLEIDLHSFKRGLSASAPRIWYACMFAKPGGRYQTLRASSKLSYKVGNGSFEYWSELVFSPSHSTRPKRAPLQGTPWYEPPLKEKVGIFGEGCEILP